MNASNVDSWPGYRTFRGDDCFSDESTEPLTVRRTPTRTRDLYGCMAALSMWAAPVPALCMSKKPKGRLCARSLRTECVRVDSWRSHGHVHVPCTRHGTQTGHRLPFQGRSPPGVRARARCWWRPAMGQRTHGPGSLGLQTNKQTNIKGPREPESKYVTRRPWLHMPPSDNPPAAQWAVQASCHQPAPWLLHAGPDPGPNPPPLPPAATPSRPSPHGRLGSPATHPG